MQEELQRIKSSTLGRKKEKPHQGSFIQTITDRLSDAKVITCSMQRKILLPQKLKKQKIYSLSSWYIQKHDIFAI